MFVSFQKYMEESYQLGSNKSPRKQDDYTRDDEVNHAKKSSLQSGNIGAYKVKVSTHAAARAFQRRPYMAPHHWADMLHKTMKAVQKERNQEKSYIVHSKTHDQAVVIHHIPKSRTIRVITTLPKGKSNAKDGTDKFMVEHFHFEEGWTTDDEFYDLIIVD
jgi:hypothetical protein